MVLTVGPGEPLALVVTDDGVAVAEPGRTRWTATADPVSLVGDLDRTLRPRWVWWSAAGAAPLLAADASLRLTRCWSLAAVHRLLQGGSSDGPAVVWAACRDLDPGRIPRPGQLDLLEDLRDSNDGGDGGDGEGDPDQPVRPDGHLRPEWAAGGWSRTPQRAAAWAGLALQAQAEQAARLADLKRLCGDTLGNPTATAWSESAAELMAVELAAEGLPVDVAAAEEVVASRVGSRPADDAEAAAARVQRDRAVLDLVPGPGGEVAWDLRSPAQVRQMLTRVGLDVPDTRSWRLERLRGTHPVVDALLRWREDDRYATTYGYRWLDAHVRGGRLRGGWSASDGGAGRMTAQAGLHSLPAPLRSAVRAQPGHLLVRADLGQVEPRVLAAVSGDRGLAAATDEPDLYAPVAERLGCERSVAKVAVLAAMYGQTSGTAGQALQGMDRAYPTAMRYLREADAAGVEGRPLRTHGGRLVRTWPLDDVPPEAGEQALAAHRAARAARGRFARNAVVQGAAAELFKAWAATVRLRLAARRAGSVVLCLHDELLLHVRAGTAPGVAGDVHEALEETAARWCTGRRPVRFVADVAVVERWSDVKG